MQFQMTDFENEKQRLNAELDAKLQQMTADLEAREKQSEARCEQTIKGEQVKFEAEKIKLEEQISEISEQAALLRGELDGIRIQQGKIVPSTDYTSRDRFKELEQEYEAFQKFFKKQWEFTKKEIRKTILWTKEEKKKKDGD